MTATAVADVPDEPDLSVLMPSEGVVDVEGFPCRVKRMRAREVLDLARIIATGVGSAVTDLDMDFADIDEFRANVTGLLLVALPNAEAETFAFLAKMVVPVDDSQAGQVRQLMQNPDLGVALDVLNTVMDQEGDGLVALLGKAQDLASKIGRLLPKTARDDADKADAKAAATAGQRGRSRARST